MRSIAVAARKGGVGKTTTSITMAALYAESGQKTLIIDLDPQSNVAYVLGGDPTLPGTAQLLLGESVATVEIERNLHVLPGGPELTNIRIQEMYPQEMQEILRDISFDCVIFDCPPGNKFLERFALFTADTVLICSDAHPLALMGAERVLADVEQWKERRVASPQKVAFVLSKIDTRRILDQELQKSLEEKYPKISRFPVRQETSLAMATASRMNVTKYQPKIKALTDFKKIMEWIEHA
jgi:chromosome partitioning protein